MKETNIMRLDMIEQSEDKESFNFIKNSKEKYTRLFRNNIGKLETKYGRRVNFGLFKGSSDNIGWESIIVTPDMVGKRIAIFKAVESKTPEGKLKPEQENFLNKVKIFGGIAEINQPEKGKKEEKKKVKKLNRYKNECEFLYNITLNQLNLPKNKIKPNFETYELNEIIKLLRQELVELEAELFQEKTNETRIAEEVGDVAACLVGLIAKTQGA